MHHQPVEAGVPVAGQYPLPAERRSRLQLADELAGLLSKDGTKLIEVLPAPGSDPLEWESLVSYRCGLEEPRSLDDAPGHLFKSRERGEFRELLSVLFGFGRGWGMYVYAAPSRTTLLVSDRLELWSVKRGGLRTELRRRLDPELAA